MIDCLLRCIRFILGPVILSVGKECQIAERMYIFACETRDCGARRLRSNMFYRYIRFLYKGIIIKHNKTEPTYTKTSLFLCEKRRFFMARTEKGVVATI